MPSRLQRWATIATTLFLLYWIALFIGTHLPRDSVPPPALNVSDKTVHFAAYTILSFLGGWMLAARGLWNRRTAFFLTTMLIMFAAFDEITQPLVNRHADWHDFYADAAGVATGVILFSLTQRVWLWSLRRSTL